MKTKIISEECEWQWVLVTETQSVAVNYPSDGLLPEYSQKLQGLPSGKLLRDRWCKPLGSKKYVE